MSGVRVRITVTCRAGCGVLIVTDDWAAAESVTNKHAKSCPVAVVAIPVTEATA